MNKQESDILNSLLLESFINQRILAEASGHSLGVIKIQFMWCILLILLSMALSFAESSMNNL